jgi:hypothetical protein
MKTVFPLQEEAHTGSGVLIGSEDVQTTRDVCAPCVRFH